MIKFLKTTKVEMVTTEEAETIITKVVKKLSIEDLYVCENKKALKTMILILKDNGFKECCYGEKGDFNTNFGDCTLNIYNDIWKSRSIIKRINNERNEKRDKKSS